MNFKAPLLACAIAAVGAAGLSAQDIKLNVPGATPAADSKAAAAPAAVPAPAYSESQALETYGYMMAKRIGLVDLGFTKTEIESIFKGMNTAIEGKDLPYAEDKIYPVLDALLQKKQQAWLDKLRLENLNEAAAFFAKLKDNKAVVELPSGLRYEIVQPGKGDYPKPTDTVKVHYTGKLLNGTVFDSSVQRGEPAEFVVDKVIPGWTEGIQKINKGGKIRLYIPPQLAYGDNGAQGIPPGATLIFDVELLDINPPQAAAPAPAAK